MSGSYREKPVLFGQERALFGVFCAPAEGVSDRPVMVMPSAGLLHRVGASRIHVLHARALAERGYASLRLDLSGIGDSARRGGSMTLAEVVQADLKDALDYVESAHGAQSFVILGLCSGAYDGLELAVRDPRVTGVVAIDVFAEYRTARFVLVHYARRLFRLKSWRHAFSGPRRALEALLQRTGGIEGPKAEIAVGVRPSLSRGQLDAILGAMGRRSVHSLFLHTGGLGDHYNYENQFLDCHPDHARSGFVSVGYLPDSDHTFTRPRDREALLARVLRWITTTPFVTTPLEAVAVESTPAGTDPEGDDPTDRLGTQVSP